MIIRKFQMAKGELNFIYFYKAEIDDNTGAFISRDQLSIPLDKFMEAEPKITLLTNGCYSIYLEEPQDVYEKKFINGEITEFDERDLYVINTLMKKALQDRLYDDLLKPPSVEEQVDSFIKDFFNDPETNTEEQEKLLEEFFKELESSQD